MPHLVHHSDIVSAQLILKKYYKMLNFTFYQSNSYRVCV